MNNSYLRNLIVEGLRQSAETLTWLAGKFEKIPVDTVRGANLAEGLARHFSEEAKIVTERARWAQDLPEEIMRRERGDFSDKKMNDDSWEDGKE